MHWTYQAQDVANVAAFVHSSIFQQIVLAASSVVFLGSRPR
jgi:hypothetical protein